jgi:hypothetical protein
MDAFHHYYIAPGEKNVKRWDTFGKEWNRRNRFSLMSDDEN